MGIDSFLLLNGCATGGMCPTMEYPSVKNKVVRTMMSSSEYSSVNAWNINPQSGQVNNNNNKYNSNVVRPVVALSKERVNGWMEAYADFSR